MITFWRQPSNKTMKLLSKHIGVESAKIILDTFKDAGFKVTDHGHKITVE